MLTTTDDYFMEIALQEAQTAASKREVPVGAVVVLDGQLIGRGHNLCQTLNDATAHAEMIALTAAYGYVGSRYLQHCSLYVTLEPCVMCAGACYWSGLGRIIYGATDEKYGFERIGRQLLHPKTQLTKGVLEMTCQTVLQDFFKKLR
jgi:tRNA(adenine34) deaminase